MNKDYATTENVCDLVIISFLITFNIFFSIFVWMPSDLSPNQAIGFISSLFIAMQIYRIRKRIKSLANGRKHDG